MDFRAFEYRAVVDWAEFVFRTRTKIQAWRIQAALKGLVSFVNGYDENSGKQFASQYEKNTPTTLFTIRIQDPPNFDSLRAFLAQLESTKAFELETLLHPTAIEIAFDAYKANPEAVARFYRFVTYLACPDNHRLYRGGKGSAKGIPITSLSSLTQHLEDGYQIGIGHENSNFYQHLYWKTTDNGKPLVNEFGQPDESQYRARIEIRLSGKGLPFESVEDMERFRFHSLTKYFRFRKLKTNLEPYLRSALLGTAIQIGHRRQRDFSRRAEDARVFSCNTQADRYPTDQARYKLRELSERWCSKLGRTTNAEIRGNSEQQTYIKSGGSDDLLLTTNNTFSVTQP